MAVLGAGLQGTGVALELSRRGVSCDLIDARLSPMMGASLWNEGKIHLGFVYAKDRSHRTAATMINGALEFWERLRRWIEVDAGLLSEPFSYLVPSDSMLSLEEVDAHFQVVGALYESAKASTGLDYLDQGSGFVFRRLDDHLTERRFRSVQGAFATVERSVDTHEIAARLRKAVAGASHVTYVRAQIDGVDRNADGSFTVRHSAGSGRYEQVVNALWGDRLRIDHQLGILPGRPWLQRVKLAMHLPPKSASAALPTVTLIVGAYGDVVRFSSGRAYLSWYPECMVAVSSEINELNLSLSAARRRGIAKRSAVALSSFVSEVADLDLSAAEIKGGVILGWGSTDISDPTSGLHERFEIGPHSHDGYHSIDTGKYTMAPAFAVAAADRVAGP